MASYMGHEYTPAPTQVVQGRYRVGDRVRVVKEGGEDGGSGHGAKVGDLDEIVAIDKSDPHLYEGRQWYYGAAEISPAFRPGDRVKLNKHSGVRACGERGTVSAVIGDNVSVRMDDASAYGTVVAFFHADNLDWERAEEPAADCAGRKEQPVAKPKFKAGDVVTYHDGTHRRTIKGPHISAAVDKEAYDYVEDGWDYAFDLILAAPCPQDNEQHETTLGDILEAALTKRGIVHQRGSEDPCIVALTKNGQPLPSRYPHVHASVADATSEAERLARNNPGQEFAVYQRVAGRVAEVEYNMREVA